MTVTAMNEINQDVYRDTGTAHHYGAMEQLFAPEQTAFGQIAETCRDVKILDIGVGGGRTTPYLLAISEDYVAIDYAEPMIAVCRQKFPGVRFEVGDARQMAAFPDGHFGLVVFSFNGIDYVTDRDRSRILDEIYRVTAEGGSFIFSSHNAEYDPRRTQPPFRRALGRAKDRLVNRIPIFESNDDGSRNRAFHYRNERLYSTKSTLRTYYIAADDQVDQLRMHGFDCEAVVDSSGKTIAFTGDSTSPWLYYRARKSQRPANINVLPEPH